MGELEKYIPKKYWNVIERTYIELDFDYGINRSVQRYNVVFKNGDYVSVLGVQNIRKAIKEKMGYQKKQGIIPAFLCAELLNS